MAPLKDPLLLDGFRQTLAEWRFDGFVLWKGLAQQWLLANLQGHTRRSVAELMHLHVEAGGEIDQVRERRPEFAERNEFHYDFRLEIDGRRVYIETILTSNRNGFTVTVVSIHNV